MSAWVDGLLGAVMGGSASMVHSIDEEEKARRLREEREANKKDQFDLAERLEAMKQRMADARAEAERQRAGKVMTEVDAAVGTSKPAWSSSTKQGDAIDAGETSEVKLTDAERLKARIDELAKRGEHGLLKTEMDRLNMEERAADRKTELEGRAQDRQDRAKDREERDKDRDENRKLREQEAADRKKDREQARKDAEQARKDAAAGNWRVDDKGRYVRPDGSFVMREIREGGRKLGEEHVMAPQASRENPQERLRREEYIALLRKDMRTEEEEERLNELRAEFAGSPKRAAPSGERPPLKSFDRK